MIYLHIFVSENKKMLKKHTQKQIDNWNRIRANGVKKYLENKKKKPVVRKKSPVLKPISKKRTPINKKSKKQSAREREYLRIRKLWFKNPENQKCKIRMTKKCIEDQQPASDVHHSAGRIGNNLLDTSTWVPGCRLCHRYAEEHSKEAYDKGVSRSRHAIN